MLNVSQAGKKKVYIMRAVDEEDEDNFPMKYLQQRQERLQSICLSSIFLFIDNFLVQYFSLLMSTTKSNMKPKLSAQN